MKVQEKRNRFSRLLSMALAFALMVTAIPQLQLTARAAPGDSNTAEEKIFAQSRAENFNKNYTLTGNGAADMVSVALAQVGRTGAQFGYTEAWCADFASDCAKLCGQSTAVPANASSTALMNAILRAGGYDSTSSPRPGDICLVDWDPQNGNGLDHTEIVYSVSGSNVYTLGGNTGSTGSLRSNKVTKHSPLSSNNIYRIVRPNYSGGGSSDPTPAHTDPGLYRVSTNSGPLTIRSGPGTNHGTVGSVPKDTVLNIASTDNGWGKIWYNNVGGYIHLGYCTLVSRFSNPGNDFYAYIIHTAVWRPIENADGNVQMGNNDTNMPKQIWRFQRNNDNSYKIQNCFDDKCMDNSNALTEPRNNVITYQDNGTDAQHWYLTDDGYIISKNGNAMALDMAYGETAPGSNVQIYPLNMTDAQKFSTYKLTTDGVDYQKPSKPSAPSVTVESPATVNGPTKIQWSDSPQKSERYDQRSYTLKVWDVEGKYALNKTGLTANHAAVNFPATGIWKVQVLAVNDKYKDYTGESGTITVEVEAAHTHRYEYSTISEPSAGSGGSIAGTCSCGDTKTISIPRLNDTDYRHTVLMSPTCTIKGRERYTWLNTDYGTFYYDLSLEPTGHQMENGVCNFCGERDPDYTGPIEPEKPDEPTSPGFEDVLNDEYYFLPVWWALENGITSGVDTLHFLPGQPCTRAQVVTFLWRTFGSPEPISATSSFTDLNQDAYYYKAVLWALENNITAGISEDSFAPDATVTREQFVTFLWRAEGKPAPVSTESPYQDVNNPEKFSYLAILWAAENGITSGTSENAFSPAGYCTRAQVITFLYRYME